MSTKYVKVAMFIVIIVVLAVAVPALAKGPGGGGGGPGGGGGGPGGGGGGGGGGGHTETATNNLSWPTIMIGGTMGLESEGLEMPSGEPLTGYPVPGDYYVQGVHKWQAQWLAASGAGTAAWGDNLIGQAKKTVGSPIRVELGLFDTTGVSMQGFAVVKLEPLKLDRESKYGTLAVSEDGGLTYHGTAQLLTPARIYDAAATFSIKNVATGVYVVPQGSNPTAEINATGKVVYGYNLRVTTAGQYEITFVIPSVTIQGVNGGDFTDHTVTLVITVGSGGGGGGGGGGGRPGSQRPGSRAGRPA